LPAIAILLLACSSEAAEVIRGKWQKVDLMSSGTPIILKAANGERMECTYISSDREMLLVVDTSGNPRRIRKSEVESIIRSTMTGRSWIDIGLSVGVAAALIAAISPEINHRDRAGRGIWQRLFGSRASAHCGFSISKGRRPTGAQRGRKVLRSVTSEPHAVVRRHWCPSTPQPGARWLLSPYS
jgi:hypothetical protein